MDGACTPSLRHVENIRKECLKQFNKLSPSHTPYFTELEGRMYDWAGKPPTSLQITGLYYRKYIQLYYNLRQYCSYLTDRYTPSELICLGEMQLNPRVKQERDHNEEQNRLYKQILAKGIEDEDDDEEDDGSGNRCGKCKNTKGISLVLRQLRSGDEPSSAFFTCGRCGFAWRVG